MKILDAHNHVGFSVDGGAITYETLDREMRRAGVSRFVLCPIDESGHDPCYTQQNDRIADLMKKDPRVIGFGRVAPAHCPDPAAEVRRMARIGLRGLKLHIISDKFKIQEARPAIVQAAALGLPVLCHSHHTSFTANARHWRALFADTGATFIVAHGGKDSYKELARIAAKFGNVLVDTTCVTINRSRYLFNALGADRFLFGSDMPYSHPQIEQLKWRLIVEDDKQLEAVFSGNACRLFGLDPAAL